jgi:hypothetical protein
MEVLLGIVFFLIAAIGLGLGSALGRGPARTSCGAAERVVTARCADCPLRRAVATERDHK